MRWKSIYRILNGGAPDLMAMNTSPLSAGNVSIAGLLGSLTWISLILSPLCFQALGRMEMLSSLQPRQGERERREGGKDAQAQTVGLGSHGAEKKALP